MKEVMKPSEIEGEPSKGSGVFEVKRMCPPGAINFFYSVNGKAFISNGKKTLDLPSDLTTE